MITETTYSGQLIEQLAHLVDEALNPPRCEFEHDGGYECKAPAIVCHLELEMYLCCDCWSFIERRCTVENGSLTIHAC